MNPSESNLAAGDANEALLSHQQPEASKNISQNGMLVEPIRDKE